MANSKKDGFTILWEEMMVRSNQVFFDVTLEKLKIADLQLRKELMKAYGAFFSQIAIQILARYGGSGTGPTMPQGWKPWQPLSKSWLSHKKASEAKSSFYSGITRIIEKKKEGSGGVVHAIKDDADKTPNFRDYLKTLKLADVEDSFGKLEIEYTLQTYGKKYTTRNIQGLSNLAPLLRKDGELPSKLRITAEVVAFKEVSGFIRNEYQIVEHIIYSIGMHQEWQKINAESWRKNRRPIRAVIGPRISWFMQEVSIPALQRFNESLK